MADTPDLDALAALHAKSFITPRPWSASELAGLLASEHTFLIAPDKRSMALGRVIMDEAELLTIAVAPEARGQGAGRKALRDYEREARERGAATSFLEVAADNHAAITLYHSEGYTESGRRKGYYTAPDGTKITALILTKPLKQA